MYDNPIPGYGTNTVGNLRLFEATPVTEFNLADFNEGAYDKATLESRKANDISAVLYPNDATEYGKELRLKQQIFFVSASIQARVLGSSLVKTDSGPLEDQHTHNGNANLGYSTSTIG